MISSLNRAMRTTASPSNEAIPGEAVDFGPPAPAANQQGSGSHRCAQYGRNASIAAHSTGEMRRTIDAREHDLIAEPGDAHHGIAVERAITGEAVDFGPPAPAERHLAVTQR